MGKSVLSREELEGTLVLLETAVTTDANVKAAAETLKRALRAARSRKLLTIAEATDALGIRSINTVKRWVKTGYIQGSKRNERTIFPVSEVERIWHDDRGRALHASSLLHEENADFGGPAALTEEELVGLVAARPGRPSSTSRVQASSRSTD